jgi:hypothetical protein
MAADTSDDVFELVTGPALDALEDGAAAVAIHGLKNELNRLHELHKNLLIGLVDIYPTGGGPEIDAVWTRIIVIQEALLDVVRMIVKDQKAA